MPQADAKIKLHNQQGQEKGQDQGQGRGNDRIEPPAAPQRHIKFSDDRSVRSGVILQIGGEQIPLTGLEFFRLLQEAKSYAQDWGSGDRPSRADIREAIRQLKATSKYAMDRHQ